MITFLNSKCHGSPIFSDYLAAPGYSHSFLKYNVQGAMPEIIATDKMRFGSMVDGVLSNTGIPATLEAREVAAFILKRYPWIAKCKSQQHYTSTAQYVGLSLSLKTLVDFTLPGLATVELKCCDIYARNAEQHINYMGYDNQVLIESGSAGCPKPYILMYCRKSKECVFTLRKPSHDWICEQVLIFGK